MADRKEQSTRGVEGDRVDRMASSSRGGAGVARPAGQNDFFEDDFVVNPPDSNRADTETARPVSHPSPCVNESDRRSHTPQPPPPQSNTNSAADNRLNQRKANRNSSQCDEKDFQVDLICPRVNCPEKIVICMDFSQEMDKISFRSRAGDKFAPLKLVKRALGIFLQTKHRIDRRHEYALVLVHSTAHWAVDFTNDPNTILNYLEDLEKTFQSDAMDLGSIFDEVRSHVNLPHVEQPRLLPPPYIVRVIFIYGRSYCVPQFENRESLKLLQASPHFFLDAYYIHEPPTDENHCEEIFDVICDLDVKGLSYVFEVSRNPTKLYDCMAQLLSHPLQRPLQKDCSYDIEPVGQENVS